MPAHLRTLIYPLLLPGGALFLAVVLSLQGGNPHWLSHPLVDLSLPLVAGAGALLAWRFHRNRLVLGLALVCSADLILRRVTGSEAAAYAHAMVAVLLPLNLTLVTLLPERGLLTLRGAGRIALIGAQVAAAVWWYLWDASLALHWLERPWFGVALPGNVAAVPQAATAAFAIAASVLAVRCIRHPTALDAGFLWALAACLGALLQPVPALRSAHFSGAALILVAGLVEAFHFLAFRDELTGLPARRALNEILHSTSGPFVLAMVDVDHFKKVNDRHGHDVGDQVLKMLATRLAAVSGGGRAYRYGGEEFTVLFPRKSLEEALPHLERVRERIAATPFRVRRLLRPVRKPDRPPTGRSAATTLRVTVSIGAAERGARHPSAEAVLQAADKALYKAKKSGRNRVRS